MSLKSVVAETSKAKEAYQTEKLDPATTPKENSRNQAKKLKMYVPLRGYGVLRSVETFLPQRGHTYLLRGFNSTFLDRRVVTFAREMKSYYVFAVNLTESALGDGETLDENVLYRDCAVCPADVLPFQLANLYIEPGDLSFVEGELVLCLHEELGCQFVGQLRHLEHHHYHDCAFGPRIAYRGEGI
ncbi:hypothetical protein MTO96_028981 [Rhipicephalus appendiculatus]